MRLPPPRVTRSDTLFPYPTLFRSLWAPSTSPLSPEFLTFHKTQPSPTSLPSTPSARLEPPLSTSRRRSCVAPGRPTRHARSTGHVTCPGFPAGRGRVAVLSLRSRRGGLQTRYGSVGSRREGGLGRWAGAGRRGGRTGRRGERE